MIFYDYLLNIDTTIYQSVEKERGLIESIVIKLDDFKKLIKVVSKNISNIKKFDEAVEEIFEKIL